LFVSNSHPLATIIPHLFALTVFLSDDYLTLIHEVVEASRQGGQRRFFVILKRLPMELQMVVANRLYGSAKSFVLTKDSEPAFRKIAAWRESATTST